ncbi:MAG: glycosyltransferase family 9 protein [Candidatus Kaelpia imicola]|nr:glycosyltransferase family 9 protein [Candidatus Kaelpia imicola]
MKKALLFRNDRLGEFLLNIPALRAIKETYNSKVTIVVSEYLKDLASCIEYVDKVLVWNNEKHSLIDILRFSSKLKAEKFDFSISFNPTKEAHLIGFLSRIPIRAGYDKKLGFLLNHKIKDYKALSLMHEVEYNLELVSLIGAETRNRDLNIKVSNEVLVQWDSFLKEKNITKYMVVHPFTSYDWKSWPMDRYFKLIQELKDKIEIVIVGGEENKDNNKFDSLVDDLRVFNLVGKTDLLKLSAVLKKAALLVSNDSGPVHLSCSVNTPVVALFNTSKQQLSARRWGPWGDNHSVIESGNISDIEVSKVLNKASEYLF